VRLTVADVDALDRGAFVQRFGAVYEHSPWVAEQAWERRPFTDRGALHAAMAGAVAAAPADARLALVRAHPVLAGREAQAGELSVASQGEQHRAGLDRLTREQKAELDAGNAAYAERFGFPFVVCVRGHTPPSILAALHERLAHERDEELRTALAEIDRIAALRLEALVRDG
jgi:OHCU decarboxylase